MPHRMLRNRTLCQASRVAFGFSGIHDADEAQDIIVDVAPQSPQKQLPAEPPPAEVPAARPAQEELASAVIDAGFDFSTLQRWGAETGNLPGADTLSGFGDVALKDARRLLRAKDAMLADLARFKEVLT
jgi:hypothetical protein